MRRAALIPLLLLLAGTASAETIWLRGRGDRVWIERDGEIQEPRSDRKGFTRVVTSLMPIPYPRSFTRPAPASPRASASVQQGGVVLGEPHWRERNAWGHSHGYRGRDTWDHGDKSFRKRHHRDAHRFHRTHHRDAHRFHRTRHHDEHRFFRTRYHERRFGRHRPHDSVR